MPRQKSEKTRQRIVDAATKLFGTRGYHETGVADIAEELRMGHGTFYRYFHSKRDVLDHVVTAGLERIVAVTRDRDPTAPTTLREHAADVDVIGKQLTAAFVADAPAARVVFYEAPGVDQALRDRLANAFDALTEVTAAYLRNGKRRGYLRTHFDEHATAAALTAILFEGIRQTLRAEDPEAESRKWIATYQLLASGLAA